MGCKVMYVIGENGYVVLGEMIFTPSSSLSLSSLTSVHSHTHIGSLECWCVIDTVSCHSSLVPKFSQALYDQVFVLRENLSYIVKVVR